ncbi:MAG: zinc ribbon domain-containing protein [Oscillospiraceae bacterium]|nr:zinc ribbon domain-containing protein [Oscillospiraceae bacterium]
MKHCTHCGKELPDEAIVCPGCGCAVTPEQGTQKKKSHLKLILIIAIAAVLVAGAVVGGIFLRNHLREEKVKDQLAGKTFRYESLSLYSYRWKEISFDENAQCKYTYFYSSVMSEPETYSRSYEIEFKNGSTFLIMGVDTYEVRYNSYGKVDNLYDVNDKTVYD